MAERDYYIKIRGRVVGPVGRDRIVEMIREGSLSRVHKLSTDSKNWRSANEFPKFFKAASQPSTRKSEPKNAAQPIAAQVAIKPEKTQVNPTAADYDFEDDSEDWYYGINDQSTGPVSRSTLVKLLANGQLSQNDSLWKKGMDDWKPVNSFREFGGKGGAARTKKGRSPAGKSGTVDSVAHAEAARDHDTEVISSETARTVSQEIRRSNVWVYICLIYLYLQTIVVGISAILNLVRGIQIGDQALILSCLLGIILTGLFVMATISLNRYATASSRFVITDNDHELVKATKSLGDFWMWLSTILILVSVVGVGIVLYVYIVVGAMVNG